MEDRFEGVDNVNGEWDSEDIVIREGKFDEVGGDYLVDGVGVYYIGEEDEGDEVSVKDVGV